MSQGLQGSAARETAAVLAFPAPAAAEKRLAETEGPTAASLSTQALQIRHPGMSYAPLRDALLSEPAMLTIVILTVAVLGWRRMGRESRARAREREMASRARAAAGARPPAGTAMSAHRDRGRGRIGQVPSL